MRLRRTLTCFCATFPAVILSSIACGPSDRNGVDLAASAFSQAALDLRPPVRNLAAIRGRLVDTLGKPITGATLTVRLTTLYTEMPESLAALTYPVSPDGF